MDVGVILSIKTLVARPEPLSRVYRQYIAEADYAEQLGFDFAATSEHHFAPDDWSPSQFLSFGLGPSERWGRLFESLEIIRRCFTEERFDHKGKYFELPNVRITTKPVQDPFPLWVGEFGPKLVERAGREGYHLQGGGPYVDLYLEAMRVKGRNPDDYDYQLFSGGHLAATWDQAWDEAQEAIHARQAMYREAGRSWIAYPDAPPCRSQASSAPTPTSLRRGRNARPGSGPAQRAARGQPGYPLRVRLTTGRRHGSGGSEAGHGALREGGPPRGEDMGQNTGAEAHGLSTR